MSDLSKYIPTEKFSSKEIIRNSKTQYLGLDDLVEDQDGVVTDVTLREALKHNLLRWKVENRWEVVFIRSKPQERRINIFLPQDSSTPLSPCMVGLGVRAEKALDFLRGRYEKSIYINPRGVNIDNWGLPWRRYTLPVFTNPWYPRLLPEWVMVKIFEGDLNMFPEAKIVEEVDTIFETEKRGFAFNYSQKGLDFYLRVLVNKYTL